MRTLQKFLGFLVALTILAVCFATGALAQGEKRLAFVIGNAAYQSGELATPANDAGLIAQTLQAAGFDVVGARDVDQESLRGAFRDFLGKVSAAGPDAVVFVYLAGHGVQFEGENYFVPVDAQISNATDVPIAAVRVSDLTKPLAALPTKVNIIVLDAARPNSFAQSKQPLAGGLALVDPDPNMLIAFNAAPGTVAPGGKGPYGAYAQALAEMMREGGLPLDEVFDRTRLRVNEVTEGGELPWSASKITEPFVFFERGPDAPPPQVSAAEVGKMRTKEIRDFDALDAYAAALERDTLRGYQDFLAAYPQDPMARRVHAIIGARREAITWRETWLRDTPEAYWSYLERYPHGPHAWDARRRLAHFDAALEPPEDFTLYVYDVPPPPPEEIVYIDRLVIYFDDPDFDFAPPPPVAVIFLPPPPPDFIVLPPPPPPVAIFVLPVPVFVPVPVWVNPPHNIVPPPDNIVFNNIHNTTIINNTTINNETINQTGQASGNAPGGLTTGQKAAGAATGLGATALAAKVALPPLLQKKAALAKQGPGGLPAKLGQGATQGQQPNGATPLSKTLPAGKRSTEHALPGAKGKPLPLVNGKPPLLNSQSLPNDKSRKFLRKQGAAGRNQQATGNAGAAVTGEQGTGQQPNGATPLSKTLPAGKLSTEHALPRAKGKTPLLDSQTLSNDKSRKFLRKQGAAGRNQQATGNAGAAVTGEQGTGQQSGQGKKFRKLPTVNGAPAGNGLSAQERFKRNNPTVFSDQNNGKPRKLLRRQGLPEGKPLSSGQAIVVNPNGQGSATGNEKGRKFRKLPAIGGGSAGGEVNVQRNFKVNRPNENPQRQFKLQEQPNAQVFSRPRKPEFQAQPRPQVQMQERRQPPAPFKPQQPQAGKKPSCGHPGEPACSK
ncbi:caspase family protein [Mesorhizobium sp. LjNodule214]|uniref:caspase family protein n=1 Tax=Mesorhizobium sp. LjNodule214 TaxID=3342252 RepID=UPI003ED16B6C